MHGRLVALAILACTACAPAAPLLRPVPPDGGGWRELRTERFVLRTDLPAHRARELLAELEAVVHGLHAGLVVRGPGRLHLAIDVVAFANGADVDLFLPANVAAMVNVDRRWSRLTIVMKGAFPELQRAFVAHELTHVLLAASFARQPLWFQEGVACYAETLGWEGPDENVTLGRVPHWRRWPALPPAAALRDLLVADRRLDAQQYSLAWGLVHYLMHRQGEAFESLQERFADGEEPLEAWRAVFPQWDPDARRGAERLRDEVWSYLDGPLTYDRLRARKPRGPPPFAERPLSAAEVHDVRLGLPWANRGKPVPAEAFAAELDAALARGSVVAAWIRAERDPAERLGLAERAAREHPADARAWLLLAAAAAEPSGAEAALRRAVEVDPSHAAARNALAWYLVRSGRATEALAHADEAVRLAPWSPASLSTRAEVARALARCPEALQLQRRAIENIPESDRSGQLDRHLAQLAALERWCAAPAAAGGSP